MLWCGVWSVCGVCGVVVWCETLKNPCGFKKNERAHVLKHVRVVGDVFEWTHGGEREGAGGHR